MPRESLANKRQRAAEIASRLKREYPDARCSLDFETPYQLMVATILSAQCTDERVNMTTPVLFDRFPDATAMAAADIGELETIVHPTGFFRAKARNIKANAEMLLSVFGGAIPRDLKTITQLPGVGRKTGSVVLGTAFGIAEGVVVDTHVMRISQLLKLTSKQSAEQIERDLMKVIDPNDWIVFTHLMIDHGRAVCIARRPRCGDCVLNTLCPSSQV